MISNLAFELEQFMQETTGYDPKGLEIRNRCLEKTRHYDWLQALGLHETGLFICKTYARHIDLEV